MGGLKQDTVGIIEAHRKMISVLDIPQFLEMCSCKVVHIVETIGPPQLRQPLFHQLATLFRPLFGHLLQVGKASGLGVYE